MADDLTVTREGDTLVIRIPITTPTPSSSGKTLVVASTRGNQKTESSRRVASLGLRRLVRS